jgi:nitrous oxidase accessory protein
LYAQPIVITAAQDLSQVMSSANNGDIYLLKSGTYSGNITIDKKITIIGEDGAKIVGAKKGSVITINANNVTIKNLIISNSGINLASQDSAIFVNKNMSNTLIQNNTLIGNLIGVYLWGAIDSSVINNKIIGKKDLRENERGNGSN